MNLSLVAGIAEQIRSWFSGWFGAILSIIPKTFYFLCTLAFQVLDILQLLVRKVAGLDVVYYTSDSTGESGDIAFEFIRTIFTDNNSILSNIFWALIILGVILLIITTFVAVLRSEYAATDAKSASKGKIVGRAFKAIASFAIVPIVCFFGVFMANVILQALDTITSGASSSELNYTYEIPGEGEGTTVSVGSLFQEKTTQSGQKTYISYNFWGDNQNTNVPTTSTPISGLIFKAAAYRANRIRYYSLFRNNLSNSGVGAGVFDKFGTDYDQSASLLDDCFANSYQLKNSVKLNSEPFEKDYMFPFGNASSFISNSVSDLTTFDKNNVQLVWFYYDLWQFDFLLGIAAIVVCGKLLVYLVFGLMKRIFEIVVLFLIAPPIASIMPLDDGEALKKWRGKFVGKVLGAYGPIVGLNLFFVILPLINQIKFFNIAFLDSIVCLFFTIVGLIMVKDLVATISELIGADNAMKAGQDMAGEIGQTIAKTGQLAAAPIGITFKSAKFANNMRKKHASKRDLDAANFESLDSATQEALNAGGYMEKKRFLRGMRKSMSQEEKDAAVQKYREAHPTTIKSKLRTSARNRQDALADKISTRMGAMQANGLDAETWRNLSQEQQDNLMAEQRQREANYEQNKIRRKDLSAEIKANRDDAKLHGAKAQEYERELATTRVKMQELDKEKATLLSKDGTPLNEDATYRIGKINAERMNLDTQASDLQNLANTERLLQNSALEKVDAGKAEFEQLQKDIAAVQGKNQRIQTAQNIAALQKQGGFIKGFSEEGLKKAGQIMSGEFAKALYDNLSPVFNVLGDNLAKGFKDAGGWGKIEARLSGLAGKEEKISEELKNQKRILSAQDKASELLGRNRGSGGPTTVRLDDASINKFSSQVAEKINKELNNK